MAERPFSDLVPRVNASVPECPYPVILDEVRRTAIRVCERTLYWRHVQPKFDLLPGVHEYVYEKPADAHVHAVFSAKMNDCDLPRYTLEQAMREFPEWADLYSGQDPSVLWSEASVGPINSNALNTDEINGGGASTVPTALVADGSEPRIFVQVTPDKFIVLPLPDSEKTYTLRLFYALKPRRGATGMPEYILGELEDAIIHGTLQHLMAIPQVKWADTELATYHGKQYIRELTERRARANLTNARGTFRMEIPRFI